MTKTNLSPYMKPSEAKEYGIGISAWYKLIRSGEIKAIKIGRKFVVPRAAFMAWYNSCGGQVETTPGGGGHAA